VWRSYAGASLGDLRDALGDAEEAVRLAEPVGDPDLLAGALTALVSARVWLGEGLDEGLVTEALALESSSAPRLIAGRSRLRLASLMARTGAIDQGRSMCEALLVEAVGSGDEDATGLLHAELGWVEFLAGDWEASLDHLVRADANGPGGPGRLGALALLEAHLGDVEAARSHAAEGLEASERSGAVQAEILALSAMGALELSSGNASGAREHLARAWQRHRAAGFGEPAMFPFVGDLAAVLIEVGADATEVVEWLEERGRALDRPWALAAAARARALMLAAGGELPAALDALDRALGEHERVAMPFELARTLMVLGSVRRRAKQTKPARDALEEAELIFERLGARPWVEQARGELARIGGRRSAAGELTPAEHRVAKLAVAGRTNREIAETLFVSVRTVEGTLSHIYAKLGVRSRTELAVFFDEQDGTPPVRGPDAEAP
jgi:DNA-binding CsgD family transcriptional regulator/tetratricopeptide (TPR) repeat protein